MLINVFCHCQRFFDIKITEFTGTICYDTICLAGDQKINSHPAHGRCIDTVTAGRASATLHVTQDRCTGLHTGSCLDPPCHRSGMSDSLCIDDNMMLLSTFSIIDNVIDDLLLIIIILFRDQNIFCTVGNTAPQCNVSCITSHNLNDAAALMGCGSITYFINGLHGCINCRIKSDSVFCT